MHHDDLILVSVDDHLVEPRDMFDGRLPAKYADQAPRVITRDDNTEVWLYEGIQLPNLGLNAVVGRPPEEYGLEPTTYDHMRPGCYDVHERVKDMSANGVLASLNFPSFPRFSGYVLSQHADNDADQALAMIQAYNNWHIEAWAGAYPDRFIACCILPLWDPQLMVDEVTRIAEKGCHAVTFTENPYALGYPSLHTDHWDPFWAACQDLQTVVCMHLGSSSQIHITSPDAPVNVRLNQSGISLYACASDLSWAPMLRKFDNLKIALSEGGIGWMPYFLERLDYVYRHHGTWTEQDFGDKLPSEVFKEHVIVCFIDDDFGMENYEKLNTDMITWECDYPHSDTTWPTAPETVSRSFAHAPDDIVRKISHENAMRLFQFDPTPIRPLERCTAGALRAEVPDHDISIVAQGVNPHKKLRSGDLATLGGVPGRDF